MQSFPVSASAMLVAPWRHRAVVIAMVKRDIAGRYRGSFLGVAWALLNPLVMLTIYTFVFTVVFRARWGGAEIGQATFAMTMFVGITVHALVAECVNRAPTTVTSVPNFVKRIVFPLELLPLVSLGSALFHMLISVALLLLARLALEGTLPATAVLFPVVVLPLVFTTLGIAWFLAALGVFLRDISHVTGLVSLGLLFLSPVFYPVSALPPAFQPWMYVNPLTPVIEQSRAVLLAGTPPDMELWLVSMAVGVLVAWAGFAWFQKTRKGFADVL